MTRLADLQIEVQRAVMGGSGDPERLIADPPQGSRADRLDVYRNAYVLRLTEFLANDYERLRAYLGDVRFQEMADGYRAAFPSDQPNARWYSRHLPEYLTKAPRFRRNPEVAELALLERALNDAFDGPDVPICTMADLAGLPPECFASAVLELAPTVHRFAVTTNVTSLWAALKCEENPPSPEDMAQPAEIMVWRQALGARFRILGEEEAMAIDCARQGLPFAVICEMIAVFDANGDAAVRAAGYLRGWIESEIVSRIRSADDGVK